LDHPEYDVSRSEFIARVNECCRCGATVGKKNDKGETPFDLAVKNGHDAVAKKFTTYMSQSTLNRMSKPRGPSPGFPDELQ